MPAVVAPISSAAGHGNDTVAVAAPKAPKPRPAKVPWANERTMRSPRSIQNEALVRPATSARPTYAWFGTK